MQLFESASFGREGCCCRSCFPTVVLLAGFCPCRTVSGVYLLLGWAGCGDFQGGGCGRSMYAYDSCDWNKKVHSLSLIHFEIKQTFRDGCSSGQHQCMQVISSETAVHRLTCNACRECLAHHKNSDACSIHVKVAHNCFMTLCSWRIYVYALRSNNIVVVHTPQLSRFMCV